MRERGRHAGTVLMVCREGRVVCHLGPRLVARPGEALLVPGWMTHHLERDPSTRMEVTWLADLSPRARRVRDDVRVRPRVLAHPDLDALPESELPEAVLRTVAHVHEHCLTQGAAQVADTLGYTLPYLTTLLTRTTGRSLGQWLSECRLDYAGHLLQHTSASVPEIATRCGYADLSHFRRSFKQRRGMPPSHWREHDSV